MNSIFRSRMYIFVLVAVMFFVYTLIPTTVNAVSDTEGPKVESVSVDKTEVTVGDTVTFTIKYSDESDLYDRYERFLQLQADNNSGSAYYSPVIYLDVVDDTTLVGELQISDTFRNGDYYISIISIADIYYNTTRVRSDSTLVQGIMVSVYDKHSFDIINSINPLDNITVIYSNATLSNKTISGDLYIAPNSIVALNNVIINGNIYVLGTLRANSITANTLYASNMTFGEEAYGNGAVSMSGSNSVSSMSMGDNTISEVPHRIDSDLVSIDGKLSIKGAYANIATMYVNDNKVNATNSGKFYLNDIDVGDVDSITIKFVTATGEIFTKVYKIEKGTLDSDGKINVIPIITANDISVCEGTTLNLLDGVTANDKEDGNITSSISVSPETISTNTVASHKVTYSVIDSKGAQATKEITVEIKAHNYGDWTTTKEATCTADGSKEKVCADCGDKVTEVIESPGHQWNTEYTVDKKATYAAAGSKSIHCSVCDEKKPDSTVSVPKLKVAVPTLSKPTAAKKGFTAKWKKVSVATGYEVQYALNSKFTKSKKTVKITKATTVSKKITKLKAKKTYYVRIRAYKTVSGKTYYSAWSKYKTVKTK